MAELVCVSCGRQGDLESSLRWYEGTTRDLTLDPDESAMENGTHLCGDCYRQMDPEDRPRWKPLTRLSGFVREQTGG